MNKYTELSDCEINKAVFHKEKIKYKYFRFLPHGMINYNIKGKYQVFDPCNNPIDTMPIIIENGIEIIPYKNSPPLAFDLQKGFSDGILVENENIYRAAMEVYLLMKDTENN